MVKMGFSLTDIKNIFESTADEIALELDLDVTNTIDHIYKFNFDSYVNGEEQAVLYTVAGYVAHSIMKKGISCHSCSQIVSPGKMPLEINFEMINEPNADEVYAQEEFMRLINGGGLIKPSDLLYVACSHIYTLFNYIKHDNIIKKFFLVPSIQEVFLSSVFFKRVMRRKMCIVC